MSTSAQMHGDIHSDAVVAVMTEDKKHTMRVEQMKIYSHSQ